MADKIQIPETLSSIDENIATPRTKLTYPYIRILDASDTLALIIPALEKGELPIIMTYKGVTRQLGTVTKSALELRKLLPITRLEYVHRPNDATLIQNNVDMLEMKEW